MTSRLHQKVVIPKVLRVLHDSTGKTGHHCYYLAVIDDFLSNYYVTFAPKSCNSQDFANFLVCLHTGKLFRMLILVDFPVKTRFPKLNIRKTRWPLPFPCPGNKHINFRATPKSRISVITFCGYPTRVCRCKFEPCQCFTMAVIDDFFVKL